MQSVLSLLDKQKDNPDYQKAVKDLADFKKKLPEDNQTATPDATKKPEKLKLATPPAASVEPKINLPITSSPEAKP